MSGNELTKSGKTGRLPPDTKSQVYRLGDAIVLQLATGLKDGELDGVLKKLSRQGIGASYEDGTGELTVYIPRGHTFVTRPENLQKIAAAAQNGGVASVIPSKKIGGS